MSGMGNACDVCGEALTQGAYFCGECGARVPEFTGSHGSAPASAPSPVSVSTPEPVSSSDLVPEPELVPESAPELEPAAEPAVFTLIFSTGERARVSGYGRIGRMPTPPEGVIADHLIVVNDDTRTVSKNHLDIWVTPEGIEVLDLDSANGTVVSLPGIAAERLVSGTRMLIRRGTSVAIGDQSFLVE